MVRIGSQRIGRAGHRGLEKFTIPEVPREIGVGNDFDSVARSSRSVLQADDDPALDSWVIDGELSETLEVMGRNGT